MSDFFNPNTNCVVCNKKTGLAKNKTKCGTICSSCMRKLNSKGFHPILKEYTVEELKNVINTTDSNNNKSTVYNYCRKQFDCVKTNPKTIIKKWWFWIIVISIVYGISTDLTNNNEVITNNSNTLNTISIEEKQETEEERLAREEQEKKEAEEKALEEAKKERQKRIDNNSAEVYAYTEQLVKNNLKAPSTAKFSNQKFGYNEEYSRYIVSGSVDSQNSFGAMLRADFYAEYDQDLAMIYFVFDNQILLDKR